MNILNNQIAVYTGTFDPIHLGHLDVITRGSRVFKKLLIGVGHACCRVEAPIDP